MRLCKVLVLLLALATHARATVNFPSSLDDNTTLHLMVNGEVYFANYHNGLKDAILAVQTKVGVTNSAVTSTLDYKLTNSGSVDPGHKHTGSSISFADGNAGAPGFTFGNPVTDTNTGFFHPGSGLVAISSGGTETARFTGTGLGVKTTSISFPIDVAGTVRIQSAASLCFGGTGAGDNDTCMARSAAHVVTTAGSGIWTDQAIGDVTNTLNGIAAKTGAFLNVKLLPADANPSFRIAADGVTLGWGAGGASAIDTTLTRTGANAMTLSAATTISGNVTVNGVGTSSIGGALSTVNIANSTISVLDAGTNLITLADATDFVLGTTTGTRFGTGASQKMVFYAGTPIVQPTAAAALVSSLQSLGLIAGGAFSGSIATTGTLVIGTSGATITRFLTGSGTLDFPNIAAGPSQGDLTIAVTNSATGDACTVGAPSGIPAQSSFSCFVSAAGTVTVRHLCASGACDPASATYKVFIQQ